MLVKVEVFLILCRRLLGRELEPDQKRVTAAIFKLEPAIALLQIYFQIQPRLQYLKQIQYYGRDMERKYGIETMEDLLRIADTMPDEREFDPDCVKKLEIIKEFVSK